MSVPVTAEEKINKKNDVKARSLLLMSLSNKHQLTFSVVITQEDLNSKFLRNLPPEWNTHVVVWMNKADIETMSIDDLYDNFKIVEQDVKKSIGTSTGAQNMAFMNVPSTSSTNDVNTANPAYEASTVSPNVNIASPQVSTTNFSDNAVFAFMVENPNGSNLLQQDLEQIHKDDLEVINLRWQLFLLCMRAKVEPKLRTIIEVAPIADNQTMEELLQAHTEGYGEAIVIRKLMRIFLRLRQIFYNWDVPNDVIKLMMFPYSLEGAARVWHDKEPPNSILTWEDLVNKFVNQFFPPSKTTHLKNEISRFTQRFEETFGEAWERFKEMLSACPHHGFTELTQLNTFYNGLNENDQYSLNAAVGGNLLTIKESCVTCGGNHAYYNCDATISNQSSVCAATGTYNQIAPQNRARNYMAPPGFAPMQNNSQNRFNQNQGKEIILTGEIFMLLEKHGDPDKLLIPCDFPRMDVCHALADLGASINLMPLSIWKKLFLPKLTPTRMTLELADRYITRPKGVSEDVFVKVGKFHFLTDFVVVDFEVDPRVLLILGRSFSRTGRALIDVYGEEITLQVNDEAVTCNLNQSTRYSSTYDDILVNRIDIIDVAREEYAQEILGFSNNSLGGNPTLNYEPIFSDYSPSLTPFEGSDFILEEIKAYLKDESISPEIDHADCSRDRPPMLAPGQYPQWCSRFLRYIDTRPNGEALRKCILSGPYKSTSVLVQAVKATEDSPAVPEHTTVETPTIMSPKKAHFIAEKEAIHLILTGIRDDIYSTVDVCQMAQEMWEVIERLQQGASLNIQDVKTNLYWEFGKFTLHDGESIESYYTRFYKMTNKKIRNNLTVTTMQYQNKVNELRAKKQARNANPLALVATAQASQDPYYKIPRSHKSSAPSPKPLITSRSHTTTRHKGKEIAKPITPPSETTFEEDIDPEQAQREKDMQKNLDLIAKYFKKIYKPTNNNLKTSSNSKNKNVDTTPQYKNNDHSGQFGNQRMVNVAAAREKVEVRKPKRVKDSAYHKEKMLLCKQAEQGQYDWLADMDEEVDEQELEAHYSYMAKIQENSEQSESVCNTCSLETDDSHVIPDSPDICEDDIQNDNEVESISVRDSCLVALQTKQTEFEKYKAFNDCTVNYDKLNYMLNEAIGQIALKDTVIREGSKTKAYELSVVKEKHDE
nr:reverse transcriptase domain-containing protein [Tanacetum cinerariifolium]